MILEGSGNELFRSLATVVEEALDFRITNTWNDAIRREEWLPAGNVPPAGSEPEGMKPFPSRPEPIAMWLHHALVHAIEQGLSQAAETFSRAIIAECRNGHFEDPRLQEDLRVALSQLEPKSFNEAEREPFRKSMIAATAPARPAAMGPEGAVDG
jgi:hypothetical protein